MVILGAITIGDQQVLSNFQMLLIIYVSDIILTMQRVIIKTTLVLSSGIHLTEKREIHTEEEILETDQRLHILCTMTILKPQQALTMMTTLVIWRTQSLVTSPMQHSPITTSMTTGTL